MGVGVVVGVAVRVSVAVGTGVGIGVGVGLGVAIRPVPTHPEKDTTSTKIETTPSFHFMLFTCIPNLTSEFIDDYLIFPRLKLNRRRIAYVERF